jgi:hypothetical protein
MCVCSDPPAATMQTPKRLQLSFPCYGDPGHVLMSHLTDEYSHDQPLAFHNSKLSTPWLHAIDPDLRKLNVGMC